MRSRNVIQWIQSKFWLPSLLVLLASITGRADVVRLQSDSFTLEVDDATAAWKLLDTHSGVSWPSSGMASPGNAPWLQGRFSRSGNERQDSIRLANEKGGAIAFTLVDGGRTLELRYEKPGNETVRVLSEVLTMTAADGGYVIVPSREGLLVPVQGDKAFKKAFGTSEYEGCHMDMLGLVKKDSALIVTWDDAYVFPELERAVSAGTPNRLATTFELRGSAKLLRLMPLGKGDWNAIAREYRQYAEKRGYAVTLREKIRRDPHVERMVGAPDAKLWSCLTRRMNEDSTAEESSKVHWTFDEAAKVAEHLRNDVKIERCFFMVGGWTQGGYDVRHPDNLPANPECGGNEALADAVQRIQKLGYVGCLHDNVQDMYHDAKSFSPSYIEKNRDGSLIKGGRWNGGRAYMVCAPKQLELAQRPQNLGAIHDLFSPWSYFIDTTYAVGPRECFDPNHPIGRNEDIAWKIRLSDYTRNTFGIFGSECGREWALPHSDFFEGLVGVGGNYYHQLKPEDLGATVIPFFEMVYHDCQIAYGKYGYRAEDAAETVAHHVLCARPLYYHSFPDHLYWQNKPSERRGGSTGTSDRASYTRSDNGWAQGMHPVDIFVKNTHEVLGPLHELTAYNRLTAFEYLTEDRNVRRATYGEGGQTVKVTVNFGQTPAEITTETGGRTILPSWGFIVEAPRFLAFHARSWNGQDYGNGALFTLRPTDGKDLKDSASVRVFHAFGATTLSWRGKSYEVKREEVIKPGIP